MSQGNFNAPPPAKSGGGMSTLMIVLIVLGILGLICVGACGVCIYGAQSFVSTVGGGFLADGTMPFIREDQAVKDELGEPLTQENATFSVQGNQVVVDFDVKGPNGTAKAHAEFAGGNPNPQPGDPPPKPGKITVTLPSGKVVDVSTDPPTPESVSEMPDDTGDAETDGSGIPDESLDM